MAEKYSLPVKSAFSAGRGFHLQLYTGHSSTLGDRGVAPADGEGSNVPCSKGTPTRLEDLPREFIKVTKQRSTLSFTTVDFIKLNSEYTQTNI